VAVASAGLYAKSAPQPRQLRQHPTTQFFTGRCPSCHPTNSIKALKAVCSLNRYKIFNGMCTDIHGVLLALTTRNPNIIWEDALSPISYIEHPSHSPPPPQKWPFPVVRSGSPCNTLFLGPIRPTTQIVSPLNLPFFLNTQSLPSDRQKDGTKTELGLYHWATYTTSDKSDVA